MHDAPRAGHSVIREVHVTAPVLHLEDVEGRIWIRENALGNGDLDLVGVLALAEGHKRGALMLPGVPVGLILTYVSVHGMYPRHRALTLVPANDLDHVVGARPGDRVSRLVATVGVDEHPQEVPELALEVARENLIPGLDLHVQEDVVRRLGRLHPSGVDVHVRVHTRRAGVQDRIVAPVLEVAVDAEDPRSGALGHEECGAQQDHGYEGNDVDLPFAPPAFPYEPPRAQAVREAAPIGQTVRETGLGVREPVDQAVHPP